MLILRAVCGTFSLSARTSLVHSSCPGVLSPQRDAILPCVRVTCGGYGLVLSFVFIFVFLGLADFLVHSFLFKTGIVVTPVYLYRKRCGS